MSIVLAEKVLSLCLKTLSLTITFCFPLITSYLIPPSLHLFYKVFFFFCPHGIVTLSLRLQISEK